MRDAVNEKNIGVEALEVKKLCTIPFWNRLRDERD